MPDNPLQPSFWENEANELWAVMIGVFVDTLMDGVIGGVNALPPDISILMDMDVVNEAAIAYARQYRYEWISKITETTRTQTQTLIADWIRSGQPLSALEAQLAPVFGSVRAQMIAVTEVTRVFQESNVMVFENTGFVSQVEYHTVRDERVCPLCSPLDGQQLPLRDKSKHPPRHVRCRCFTTPVLDVSAVLRQTERILNG